MKNEFEDKDAEQSYKDYLDRLSMPGCPVKLTPEEVEELKKEGRLKALYEV
jgi:hypothetical protein